MIVICLAIIIVLFVLLTFVWPPDSPWSPWWRTNRRVARAAAKLAQIKPTDIVYELGSGDGEFILTSVSEFNVKKAIGIEIDYSRFCISQVRKFILQVRSARFIRSDFKKINLSEATVIYFYLVPAVIDRILPKLKKELKPGARIISLKYPVDLNLIAEDKKNNLFVYKI